MGLLEIIGVLAVGWMFGFISFAIIDCFRIMKEIKENRKRTDMEIARIKAARSVTR